jgi:hypothetical protein
VTQCGIFRVKGNYAMMLNGVLLIRMFSTTEMQLIVLVLSFAERWFQRRQKLIS